MTDAVNRSAYLNGYNAFREESNNSVWDVGKNARGNAPSNELIADFAIGLRDYLDNSHESGNNLKIESSEAALNPEVKKIFDFLMEMKADKKKEVLNTFDLAAFIHLVKNNPKVGDVTISNGDTLIDKSEREAVINAYLNGDTQTKSKIEELFDKSLKEVQADVRLQHNAQQRKLFDESVEGKNSAAAMANLGYNSPLFVDALKEGGETITWKIPVKPGGGMDKTALVGFAEGMFRALDTNADGLVEAGEFNRGKLTEEGDKLFKMLTYLQTGGPEATTGIGKEPGTVIASSEAFTNLLMLADKGDNGIITGKDLKDLIKVSSFRENQGDWGGGSGTDRAVVAGNSLVVGIDWSQYGDVYKRGKGKYNQADRDALAQAELDFGGRAWGLNKHFGVVLVAGDESLARAMANRDNKDSNDNETRMNRIKNLNDRYGNKFEIPNASRIGSSLQQLALKAEDFGVLGDFDKTVAEKRDKELENAKVKAAESAEKAEKTFQNQIHQQELQEINYLSDPTAGLGQGTQMTQQAILQSLMGNQSFMGQSYAQFGGGMMNPYQFQQQPMMYNYGMQPNMMGMNTMYPSFGYQSGFMA